MENLLDWLKNNIGLLLDCFGIRWMVLNHHDMEYAANQFLSAQRLKQMHGPPTIPHVKFLLPIGKKNR
jgi:hypothetical protein